MKNNKIVILSPYESVLTKRGNRLPLFANMLFNSGKDITFLTTDFYHAKKTKFTHDEIIKAQKEVPYKLIVHKNIGYLNLLSIKRIFSHIQYSLKTIPVLIKERPTIIILPSRPMELIFIASFFSLILRYTIILDVRDIWPDAFPEKGIYRTLFGFYCNFFLRLSMWRIKYFTYISPSFIEWIHRYSKPKEALFIPHGYDMERWSNNNKPKFNGIIKLVFIGNMSRNFDFKPLFDAVGKSDNVKLTMVGGGDEEISVKNYVNKKRFKNIHFTGFLDKMDVVKVVGENHITVIPMIGQSIPNKFFDSIGGQRPMLVLGEYDTAVFVEKEKIGWKIPFKSSSIVKLLKELTLKDYNIKYKNVKKIRNKYSKEILYKEMVDLVERLSKIPK